MGKLGKWPGFGQRLREALVARGYVKDGRVDVMRFSMERGYHTTYVYRWLAGMNPAPDSLERLSKDLDVSPGWLLFGDRPDLPSYGLERGRRPKKPTPIRGGSVNALPQAAVNELDPLSLIRHWIEVFRRLPEMAPLPGTVYAPILQCAA